MLLAIAVKPRANGLLHCRVLESIAISWQRARTPTIYTVRLRSDVMRIGRHLVTTAIVIALSSAGLAAARASDKPQITAAQLKVRKLQSSMRGTISGDRSSRERFRSLWTNWKSGQRPLIRTQ